MYAASVMQRIVDAIPGCLPAAHRYVIAIAGPPAAGKSTLARQVAGVLAPTAAMLGLDAFHLDNTILTERRDLARKGAPHTFDVDGYRSTLAGLRREPDNAVVLPEFDRGLDAVRNDAAMALASHSIIITEGNYLLVDEAPWTNLAPLFDLTVWLDVPLDVVRARILARWIDYGLDPETARERLERNDLPNAEVTIARSRQADLVVTLSLGT